MNERLFALFFSRLYTKEKKSIVSEEQHQIVRK